LDDGNYRKLLKAGADIYRNLQNPGTSGLKEDPLHLVRNTS